MSWAQEMDESLFLRGCIMEQFLWCYSIFMIAGHGGSKEFDAWASDCVNDTSEWLLQCTCIIHVFLFAGSNFFCYYFSHNTDPEIIEKQNSLFRCILCLPHSSHLTFIISARILGRLKLSATDTEPIDVSKDAFD